MSSHFGRRIIASLVLGIAIMMVTPQIPQVRAFSSLLVDGTGTACDATSGGVVNLQSETCPEGGPSVQLCATHPGGVCPISEGPFLVILQFLLNNTETISAVVSNQGLQTWTKRGSSVLNGLGGEMEEWYSIDTTASLSNPSIGVGLSGSAPITIAAQEFAITGYDQNTPFDPNPAAPSSSTGSSNTMSTIISTSYAQDMLLGFSFGGTDGTITPTAGFTGICVNVYPCAGNTVFEGVNPTASEYKIVSATQSSTSVSFTQTGGTSWAVIADAIQSGALSAYVTAGSNAVDVGQLASFSCAGAGGLSPYAYSWTFGDETTGSGARTTHIYNTPGTMNVDCTVTDSLGTTANGAVQLMVNPRVTLTSVTCAGPFITNRGSTCNVTVTDNSPGTFITPTGTVGLDQTGLISTFTGCTLAGISATAACSSTFTASAPGTSTITASYPGDSSHASSGNTESITVSSALSISSFTASLTRVDAGDKVTFTVITAGGYGTLSYSYTNLPAGCSSTNSTALSCYPSSTGNYRVTVTVMDQAMESADATAVVTVGPQRFLGLPQAMGLAVIFGAIVAISAVLILSVTLTLRRKKGRQAPTTA